MDDNPHQDQQKHRDETRGRFQMPDGLSSRNEPDDAIYDPLIPPPSLVLVGRERELLFLRKRVCRAENDVISLNGLPGVGKTTLAALLAHDPEVRAAFLGGILWAGLGVLSDVSGQLSRWAGVCGISSTEATNEDTRKEMIRHCIGNRRMLLIIDDVWTLEEALAFTIGGPHCVYLITTRFLHIAEQVASEAPVLLQELSIERSLDLLHLLAPQVVESEPTKIRALAQVVGGLPLALTLMGNYLRLHAASGQSRRIQEALERLNHTGTRLHLSEPQGPVERHPGFSREQSLSLHAVIAITDMYLSDEARAALYALSVLPHKPNSFSEAGALAVCVCSLHVLDDLVDTGLLERSGDGRYTLHQTVADYARFHLQGIAPQERLLHYAHEFVETHLTDYELLDEESSTILMALEVAHDLGNQTELIRGVCAFTPFLLLRGNYAVVERHLNRAYHLALSLDDQSGLITICLYLGQLFLKQGDYAQSTQFFQKGLVLARQIEDQERVCALLNNLGWVTLKRGELGPAETYLQEGLGIARQLGNRESISGILKTLGTVVANKGNLVQAVAFLQEGLGIARQLGNREQICTLLINLGATLGTVQGKQAQAVVYFEEGLQIARQIGHREWTCVLLINLGSIATEEGLYEKAQVYFHEGLELARQIGHREWMSILLLNLGETAGAQGKLAQAAFYLDQTLILAQQLDRPHITARAFYEQSNLYLRQEHLTEAKSALCNMQHAIPKDDQELHAYSHYGLARLAAAQGQMEQAQLLGENSATAFENMGHHKAIHVRNWLKTIRHATETT